MRLMPKFVVMRVGMVGFVVAAGCGGGKATPECEKNNTGLVSLQNNSTQTISPYIDGALYSDIAPGQTREMQAQAGNHTLSTQHADGSTACADTTVTITQCATLALQCTQ